MYRALPALTTSSSAPIWSSSGTVLFGQWPSHNRPIHEVLFPAPRDIAQEYERTFHGMTAEPVALDDLIDTRDRMMREQELPGVRWKLPNLGQLQKANPKKFAEQSVALAR